MESIILSYKVPFLIVSAFVLLDVITGFTSAALEKRVSSSKMRDGLEHKIAFYFIWIFAFIVEVCSSALDIGFTIPCVLPVTVYVVSTETVSILENICSMNPEINKSKIFKIFENSNNVQDD